jgi:TRAP-type mannitol/chloroaromatic compound transport system permease small subunit
MTRETESPPAVFTYGRLVLWLVLLLIVLSVGYAVWQVVANWSSIAV